MIVNPNSVGPQPYQPHGLIPSSTSSVGQPEDQPTMLEAALGFTDAVSLSPEAAEPVALDLNPTCEIEPSIVEAWQLPDVSEQAVTFLQGLRESIQADTSVPASVRNDFIEILDQKIVELGDLEGSPAEVNAATEQILDQVGQEYLALSPVIVGARNKISQLNGLISQDNLPDEVREQLTGIRNSLRAFVQSFLEGDLEAAQTHLDRANQLQAQLDDAIQNNPLMRAGMYLAEQSRLSNIAQGTEGQAQVSQLFSDLEAAVEAEDAQESQRIMGEIDSLIETAAQTRVMTSGQSLLGRQNDLIDLAAEFGATEAETIELAELFDHLSLAIGAEDHQEMIEYSEEIQQAMHPFLNQARAAAILAGVESLIATLENLRAQRDGLPITEAVEGMTDYTIEYSEDADGNAFLTAHKEPIIQSGLTVLSVPGFDQGPIDPVTLDDIIYRLEGLRDQLEAGVIPPEVDTPAEFNELAEAIVQSVPVQNLISVLDDINTTLRYTAEIGAIAIAGYFGGVAALGIRTLLGMAVRSAVGQAGAWLAGLTVETATFTLVHRAIIAPMHGESILYEDFGEFGIEFYQNFAMFSVLKGSAALFNRALINPQLVMQNHPLLYQAGSFATEYMTFNLWAFTEQLAGAYIADQVSLGFEPETTHVGQVLTGENFQSILLNNAKVLIGLRLANLAMRPLHQLMSLIPTAEQLRLGSNTRRLGELAELMQLAKTPKEINQIYRQQAEILEQRLELFRQIQERGIDVGQEIELIEQRLAEVNAIEQAVSELLTSEQLTATHLTVAGEQISLPSISGEHVTIGGLTFTRSGFGWRVRAEGQDVRLFESGEPMTQFSQGEWFLVLNGDSTLRIEYADGSQATMLVKQPLLNRVGEMSFYHLEALHGASEGDPAALRAVDEAVQKQLFEIGESVTAKGTGTHIDSLVSIALDGKIAGSPETGQNYTGPLTTGDGNGQFFAGPHGPFYVVLREGFAPTGGIMAQHHAAYLLPNIQAKTVFEAAIREAAERGIITEGRAEDVLSITMTYEQYIVQQGGVQPTPTIAQPPVIQQMEGSWQLVSSDSMI